MSVQAPKGSMVQAFTQGGLFIDSLSGIQNRSFITTTTTGNIPFSFNVNQGIVTGTGQDINDGIIYGIGIIVEVELDVPAPPAGDAFIAISPWSVTAELRNAAATVTHAIDNGGVPPPPSTDLLWRYIGDPCSSELRLKGRAHYNFSTSSVFNLSEPMTHIFITIAGTLFGALPGTLTIQVFANGLGRFVKET